MDYKASLNLPRTEFPMKADLVEREPQRLERWQANRLYDQIQARRAGAERFILHDGPPFANGDVHIGTAGNKILKDFVVRYQTLRGRLAPYVPGWDCHGLPIEFKVSQEMRKSGDTNSDPVALRRACAAYARKYIDLQRRQFQRLGVLGDWEHPYLTLDPHYEAEELRLLATLVEAGFIYRGKKPVYWSIPCRTALAEAEVEYRDHVSASVFVKFPVLDHPNTFILIWTTTPWTLPANLAVAYNSTFYYSLIRVDQELYLVSANLTSAVAAQCEWESYEIVRSLDETVLRELTYQHPFCARTGRLYAGDNFVDNTTGTGFVHIAPGHGLEDYALGRQQGLPIYSPVDDQGCLAHTNDLPVAQQMPVALIGRPILEKGGVSEANQAVLAELTSRQALVHRADYTHSYPHCWRSKTPVIFRAMDQWFVRIDHQGFRERALEEIGRVSWVPDWGRSRIEAAVKSRPDWCISRQRAWGVPLPAFYDEAGEPMLDARIVRAFADLVERHGSNIWFEQSTAQLWSALRPADWAGPEAASKSGDTVDVWIDSGSSSRAVLMSRPELQRGLPGAARWQADLYLEGSDQHRGWFQSSLLLSLAGNGAAPFKTVLTHGFMVDADREKISKSKQGQGGYQKPQTADAYVKRYGVDVLRLWVASQDFRGDIVVSDERIGKVGETYRLLRNTLRYQLSNLYDFDPAKDAVAPDQMDPLDRWILARFSVMEEEVMAAYDRYEFHTVYQKVSQFAAVELSAVYHDLIKDRLYTDPVSAERRRSTQTALWLMLGNLCRMLSPLLCFTADEAWDYLPGRPTASVHLADWAPLNLALTEGEEQRWSSLFRLREAILPELEKARQAKQIGKALEAAVTVCLSADLLAGAQHAPALLRELLNVSQLTIEATPDTTPRIEVARAAGAKCERCWHWETDVGRHATHPGLCARCVDAVEAR